MLDYRAGETIKNVNLKPHSTPQKLFGEWNEREACHMTSPKRNYQPAGKNLKSTFVRKLHMKTHRCMFPCISMNVCTGGNTYLPVTVLSVKVPNAL